jgi:O-antigen/teichoic acid export membrane protein
VNGLFFARATRWIPLATIAAGALNVGLNLLLTPIYGIQAAAVNTAIGFAALLAIVFVVGQRRFPVAYEYGRLARVFLVAASLFALGWFVAPEPFLVRLAWKLALVGSFPLWLVASGFLTRPERIKLGLLWAAARQRYHDRRRGSGR